MKTHYVAIWVSLMLCNSAFTSGAAESKLYLLTNVRRSGETNEWHLPLARLKALPRWNPVREQAPLSLDKAIQKAISWIMVKEGLDEPNVDVEDIGICSLHSDDPKYRHVFYYKITMGVLPYDRAVCIVLMDGSILEPENAARGKETK